MTIFSRFVPPFVQRAFAVSQVDAHGVSHALLERGTEVLVEWRCGLLWQKYGANGASALLMAWSIPDGELFGPPQGDAPSLGARPWLTARGAWHERAAGM